METKSGSSALIQRIASELLKMILDTKVSTTEVHNYNGKCIGQAFVLSHWGCVGVCNYNDSYHKVGGIVTTTNKEEGMY